MIGLTDIQARVGRLEALAQGLAAEVRRWQSGSSGLPGEQRAYLGGIQDALASLDEARVVLAAAARRLTDTFGPDGPLA
jgi:hypothetical protein